MKIVAEHITSENFHPYGTCIDLYQNQALVKHFSTDSFADHMTIAPLIDTPGHLGLTVGSPAPYSVGAMEKHAHTQEAIFCLAEPVILCVAASRGNEPPLAEDVRAFLIHPGQVAVMERNIWHDACHGLGKNAPYYYLATAGANPAQWVAVSGQAEVTLP